MISASGFIIFVQSFNFYSVLYLSVDSPRVFLEWDIIIIIIIIIVIIIIIIIIPYFIDANIIVKMWLQLRVHFDVLGGF